MLNHKEIYPGDVILFSGKSFVSRGIMWFTGSKYSHVGIAVSGTHIIESTQAGVEKNELAPLVKNTSAICVRRAAGLTLEQAELIKDKAYSLIYQNYDFAQLFSLGVYFFFRRLGITWSALVSSFPGRLICSELVAVCYLTVPIKFKKSVKLVTPADLYLTDKLDTIFEEKVS